MDVRKRLKKGKVHKLLGINPSRVTNRMGRRIRVARVVMARVGKIEKKKI